MSLDQNIDNELHLPVSIGEALDKLSILEIKLDNITDSRRDNVKVEYEMLYEKLESYIKQSKKYYDMLKKTNEYIWKLMDRLRDEMNMEDTEYTKLCKETVISNDVRFRIKNKINNLLNSKLKEQKGYKVLRILFDFTDYDDDNIIFLLNPLIYYSILYDEIHIKTNNINIINHIKKYIDGIQFITVINENNYDYYKNIYILNTSHTNETSIYNYLGITKKEIEIFI
jgi:hypothetical protein